jgi:FkbH-like protein
MSQVKCVVWDLDNTVWSGILLEGDAVEPRAEVVELIQALDARGVINSVASRGDDALALAKLEQLGICGLLIAPQIGLQDKSRSIELIAEHLGIGLDTVAFVDDDRFERAEVASRLPQVKCIDAIEIEPLLAIARQPIEEFTVEARGRRVFFQSELLRREAENACGDNEAFRRSLNMRLDVRPAKPDDLRRVTELISRTNQMNSSGRYLPLDTLQRYIETGERWLLVAEYQDRFGDLGCVGVALICPEPDRWTLELLLVSCRVLSRGVGGAFLQTIIERALAHEVRLLAEYVPLDRNRIMSLALGLAGFQAIEKRADGSLLMECVAPPTERVQPIACRATLPGGANADRMARTAEGCR